MKTVVLTTLLAAAGAAPLALTVHAQPQGGGVQMAAEEYAKYQTCQGAAQGAGQATACQDYLKAFPNSVVKKDVLFNIMRDYVAADDNKNLVTAADAVIASDPNSVTAYFYGSQAHVKTGDAAGAADMARKGIALGKPAGMPDEQYTAVKTQAYPLMYSAIANGAAASGDQAAAITGFKQELSSVPVAQTTAVGTQLQDTYGLATSYYKSTPPDYVNCAYYAARGMAYAPEPYKTTFGQLAKYCYTKFHGSSEGFDAVTAVAKDNLDPPASFSIKPAPKPEDYVATLLSSTPDKSVLAPSDREFVLQYGTDEQKASVFDPVKGKAAKFPDVVVVSATADKVMAAVSDDAVQNKVADYEFDMKAPLKTIPATGAKITLVGTYSSFATNAGNANNPVSIVMTDGSVEAKAPARGTPGKGTPARRPAAPARRR